MPLILRQRPVASPQAVAGALTDAFLAIREALAEGRPAVVVVAGADLLGQGEVADAAVATGLLGMVRTFAIEGARAGWSVNVLARGVGAGEEETGTAAQMLAGSGLSGQAVEVGTAGLGKVVP